MKRLINLSAHRAACESKNQPLFKLCLLMAMLFVPFAMQAEDYSLWVNGTQVTDANKSDVFSNGKISYNSESNTLTLNELYVNGEWNSGIEVGMPSLNVFLVGYNTMYNYISSTGGNLTVTFQTDPYEPGYLNMNYDNSANNVTFQYENSLQGTLGMNSDLSIGIEGLGLSVGGVEVNASIVNDILHDAEGSATGSVSFDTQNNKLTLNNATINGSIASSLESLTIAISGNNSITDPETPIYSTYGNDGAGPSSATLTLAYADPTNTTSTLTINCPEYAESFILIDGFNVTLPGNLVNIVGDYTVSDGNYVAAAGSSQVIFGAPLEAPIISLGEYEVEEDYYPIFYTDAVPQVTITGEGVLYSMSTTGDGTDPITPYGGPISITYPGIYTFVAKSSRTIGNNTIDSDNIWYNVHVIEKPTLTTSPTAEPPYDGTITVTATNLPSGYSTGNLYYYIGENNPTVWPSEGISISETTTINYYYSFTQAGGEALYKSPTLNAEYVIRTEPSITLSYTNDAPQEVTFGGTLPAPTVAIEGVTSPTVTWASDNTAIATVNATTGVVTAVAVPAPEAETQTAIITATFAGNETLQGGTASYEVKVVPKAVTADMITLSATELPYTSSDNKPIVTAKDGTTTLSATDDYTLSYTQGESAVTTCINVGTYSVVVTGKGNYTGSANKEFTITKANAVISNVPKAIEDLVFTGEALTLISAGTAQGGTIQYSTDGETYSDDLPTGTNVGEHTVYYKVVGDANHNDTEAQSITVNIAKANFNMEGITFENASFVYDGQAHSLTIEGTLPEGLTVSYSDNNSLTAVGSVEVTATFATTNDNYNTPEAMTATLTVTPAEGDLTVTLTDATATFTYDGQAKEPAVTVKSGETTLAPDDYDVEYANNTNAGTATITVTGKENFAGATGATTFTIAKASYDMSGVTFADASFVYDGQPHSIVISGTLPEGVTASYENNERTEVGEQTATAKFTGDATNYEAIADMTATLTITSAAAIVSKAPMAKTGLIYNGTAQALINAGEAIGGEIQYSLTSGSGYSTTIPTGTNAGEYNVYYKVVGDANHNDTEAQSITVNIAKANFNMEGISFTDGSFVYDGQPHSLAISGQLPEGLTVSYSDNNSLTAVGSVTVTATFATTNTNYNVPEAMTATLTVTPAAGDLTVTLADANVTFTYDGQPKEPAVTVKSGEATLAAADYEVAYASNTNAGTATITITGKGNYAGATGTATFTIAKATYNMSGVTFENASFEYDGQPHSIVISGQLPQGVRVNYENNERTEVGTQTATAKFTGDATNYEAIADMTATLTITEPIAMMINGAPVTNENKNDVLEDGTNEKAPSVVYHPEYNTLVLTDAQLTTIDCLLPQDLTIYLIGSNTAANINGEQANLIFETDGNFPGSLTLQMETENAVISNFKDIVYQQGLELLSGATATPSAVIGVPLEPITKAVTYETPQTSLNTAETEATAPAPGEPKLVNVVINDVLYTYILENENGIDDTDGSLVINTVTTDAQVAENMTENTPTSNVYAEKMAGITFMIPAGTGTIKVTAQTFDGYMMSVKIGSQTPFTFMPTTKEDIEIPFAVNDPTLVTVYNSGTLSSAARRVNPIGKKTTHHVKVYSVSIAPQQVKSSNPVNSVAPDYPINKLPGDMQAATDDVEIPSTPPVPVGYQEPTAISQISTEGDDADGTLYDLSGRPVKGLPAKGLYIKNGKKVVVD